MDSLPYNDTAWSFGPSGQKQTVYQDQECNVYMLHKSCVQLEFP